MATDTGDLAPGRVAVWNDPRYRSLFFQAVLLAAVVIVGYVIYHNTKTNLDSRGIASGFGFLGSTAGFGIIQTLVPYSEESSYGTAFLVSLLNTLLLAFVGIIFATILGFIIGVARLSSNWLIAKLAAVYIESFRNVPLLLQIFFWYNAVLKPLPGPRQSVTMLDSVFINNRGLYVPKPVPESGFGIVLIVLLVAVVASIVLARWGRLRQERTGQPFHTFWVSTGLIVGLPVLAFLVTGKPLGFNYPELKGFNFDGGLEIIPEFVSMLLALVIYTASFIAENVRAGIMSVSHGQTEAAYALGLRPSPTMRLVVIPQALRVIIPPLTSQYLNLTKNSSLATAIAYPDLVSVFAGTVLNQTGQAVEIIFITMAIYLSISLLTSLFMNWYNARVALVER